MNHGELEPDPLDAGLNAMRARLGECPGASALADFAAGSLPSEEAERIGAHVSLCGICDSLVERLRSFDEPAAGNPPGWADAEGHLRARVFPRPRWQTMLLHPAMAYGLALAAVVVAIVPRRHPAPATPPAATAIAMESVRTIDLDLTRGGEDPRFAVGPGDKFLLLSFVIDIHPALHYTASLDGGPMREVVSTDGKGNFALLFSRDLLGAGRHRLAVAELDPGSGKTERRFEFAFQL
jgi:hypothetical protein